MTSSSATRSNNINGNDDLGVLYGRLAHSAGVGLLGECRRSLARMGGLTPLAIAASRNWGETCGDARGGRLAVVVYGTHATCIRKGGAWEGVARGNDLTALISAASYGRPAPVGIFSEEWEVERRMTEWANGGATESMQLLHLAGIFTRVGYYTHISCN